MFLRHLFISCRMDEVDRRREAIRQRRSARGLGSFLEVETFLSTRHSRRYQDRIQSELRELLLLESGTSNYCLDNCAARAAWHMLIFYGACTDFPLTDDLLHHTQDASHLNFMFRYSVSVDWPYKDNHFLNYSTIESTALLLLECRIPSCLNSVFPVVWWSSLHCWHLVRTSHFLCSYVRDALKVHLPEISLVTYLSV